MNSRNSVTIIWHLLWNSKVIRYVGLSLNGCKCLIATPLLQHCDLPPHLKTCDSCDLSTLSPASKTSTSYTYLLLRTVSEKKILQQRSFQILICDEIVKKHTIFCNKQTRDLDQGQCMALRQIEGLIRIPSSRIQSQSGRKHAGNIIWKNVIDYQIIMENLANLWCFVGPILLLPGNLLTLLLRQEGHILHACRGLAATNNWSSIACICIWEMLKHSLTAMHVQTCRVVSPFFCVKTGCSLQHPTIQDQKAPTLQSLWSLRLASPEMWPRCILGPGGMIKGVFVMTS